MSNYREGWYGSHWGRPCKFVSEESSCDIYVYIAEYDFGARDNDPRREMSFILPNDQNHRFLIGEFSASLADVLTGLEGDYHNVHIKFGEEQFRFFPEQAARYA